jgi:KaiC/GvpD/RAD55 family RecA-like ATPase
MSIAELIVSHFRGRRDVIAIGKGAGFEPFEYADGIQPEWLDEKHLSGVQCLGFYLLTAESECFCTCVDFDNKPDSPDPLWKDKAEQVYFKLCSAYLSPIVEISQSGNAAHVWLFFEAATPAWLPRAFWRALAANLGTDFKEVYPRQDRLTGKGIGNLVRYPLWGQSHFVEIESEWSELSPEVALDGVRKVSGDDLKLLAFEMGLGELKPEVDLSVGSVDPSGLPNRVAILVGREWTLLGKRWRGETTGLKDESRSGISMSIAVELVRQYVPTPEIEAAIRYWCRQHGASDKADRDDWIGRTVAKAYDFILSKKEVSSINASTFRDAAHAYLDMFQRGEVVHVGSGIKELDESIDGVSPGEVAIIAGRPGHGKSALGAQWIDAASSRGIPCLFISEEMSAIELGKRRILSISDVPQDDWTVENVPYIREQINDHHATRAPVYIVESCSSIDRVEEVIDQFCQIHGVKMVCVDYIQLLSSRGDRYEAVTDISRRIKQAARRNNCSVLALAQLNRGVEKRDDAIPKLSDLRESGQIEQDADLIVFVQWPCKIDPKADPEEYRLIVGKRRNGPIRMALIDTVFNPARQFIGEIPVIPEFESFEDVAAKGEY